MTLMLAGEIGVEGIFYSSLGFVILVSLFWPWWKTQLGWTVCAKSIALGIAVSPAMLMYWFGLYPYRHAWLQWVAIAALWLVPLILAWRLVVLFRVQRKATATRSPPPPLH